MAEETISLPAFNLGIQDGGVYGNLKDAESFLSDTASVTGDGSDLIDKDTAEEEEEKKKKAAEKKQTPAPTTKKKDDIDPEKLAEDFLSDEEDEEEEESEEEKKKAAENKGEGNEEEEGEGNQFETLSKELFNLGVFTTEEGEEPKFPTTPEEFLDTFNQEKQKGATIWLENFLARFGDDRREMFDAIFVSGVEPKAYLTLFNEIESFENISLTEESNQEKVVRAYYKRGGLADDKIQAKIDKLKSYGDLEEEATSLHPLIVEQDKQKLEDIVAQKEQETKKQMALDVEYKASITKLLQEKIKEKNLDGIPLDDKKAQKAFDYMYTKKWKTPSGELLTDFDKFILESKRPENIALRTKIALLAQDNFDFSKIEKKAISKESSSLFSSLAQRKEKKSNKTPVAGKSAWDNL